MIFFITGTGTDVGKTLVSSWLCVHTGCEYFKPIQTGSSCGTDSQVVANLARTKIYTEAYIFQQPLSPHLAALHENKSIDIQFIVLPKRKKLIIEGAGGILVPINKTTHMIDLIKQFDVPVILVCQSGLGTINHTLLSLETLRARHICVCGVIMSGGAGKENSQSIERYGQTTMLGHLPSLNEISYNALKSTPLSKRLKKLFKLSGR